MSGLRGRFAEGDRVAQVRRIAQGIDKRREGEVIAVGAKGVQIRFDDGGDLWQPAHGIEMVREGKGHRTPKLAVVDTVIVAPRTPLPSADDMLSRLEAQGIDLEDLFRAIGGGLVERRRARLAAADEAVEHAEQDVRAAEAMLSDARSALAAAKAAAEDVRTQLAKAENLTGVLR